MSTDGNMDLNLYYQIYMKDMDVTYQNFRNLLKEHHRYDIEVFQDSAGTQYPLMMLSLKNSSLESGAATIGVLLDYQMIQSCLPSANSKDSDVEMMILTETGKVITPENGAFHLETPDYSKLKKNSRYLENDSEHHIWVTSYGSEQTNWTYLMLTTSGVLARDISRVRLIFVTGLFLSICTGFFLSWYLAGRNYNPFVKVIALLKEETTSNLEENLDEMQWLSRQVEHILQKNVDAQKMLDKNKKHMREFCLWNLLMAEADQEQLKRYEIQFPYEYFLVAILLIKPIMEDDKTDQQTAGLRRFIVHNIFSELLEEQYHAECFEFGDRIITIFNLPENAPGVVEDIHEKMEKLREMICNPFHFDIYGLIGSICWGIGGIRNSYKEAVELSEYLVALDENIISVEDICGMESQYGYAEGFGENIVRMVSVGNQNAAEAAICEVFDKKLRGGVSLSLYRSLVYEIIGSLLRGAAVAGYMDAVSRVQLPGESVIRHSMDDTKEQLLEAVRAICSTIHSMRQSTADNFNLSQEINAYIDAHFTDPDLNISITSQHFDRSPAYLSGIYKKQTGKSLLEYINQKRIVCAEQLLKDGVSVVEAAERSGFRDSGGLIRTFKRYRGITPGQLKGVKCKEK